MQLWIDRSTLQPPIELRPSNGLRVNHSQTPRGPRGGNAAKCELVSPSRYLAAVYRPQNGKSAAQLHSQGARDRNQAPQATTPGCSLQGQRSKHLAPTCFLHRCARGKPPRASPGLAWQGARQKYKAPAP